MKNYLKEQLNTLRTNKTLIWQTMVLTIGGTLSLLIKILNSHTNLFEILLILIGLVLSIFLAFLVGCISNNIENLHNKLKDEELNNE